jgi:transposase-like protein
VRWKVAAARRAAVAHKQRILTDAARDGTGPQDALANLAAPDGADPARVIELRDVLRERLHHRDHTERRRAHAPNGDLRRRYSDDQIDRAVSMVLRGSTIAAAAAAVGARYGAVRAWASEARATQPTGAPLASRRATAPGGDLRRRFTNQQIDRAVSMVLRGSTLTAAAAAVGASHPTVLRWVRRAA